MDYATAWETARIRAMAGCSAPDALIVAGLVTKNIDVLVTNEASWPARLQVALPGASICVLRDLFQSMP